MSETQAKASPTTCIVGCKLPHGLRLELFDKGPAQKNRIVKAFVVLKGSNAARIVGGQGGYGLTDGVQREFMDQWLKENSEHAAVRNGSIFVHNTVDGARGVAKESAADVRTGLEAIDPLKDKGRHRIQMTKEDETDYRKKMSENPDRNRQIIE